MADSIKVTALEGVCNTVANSFGNVALLRITNIDSNPHLLTFAFANALTYGTTTALANCDIFIQKGATDLLSSNATTAVVLATPVRRGTIQ
jgi:hypothetical protein